LRDLWIHQTQEIMKCFKTMVVSWIRSNFHWNFLTRIRKRELNEYQVVSFYQWRLDIPLYASFLTRIVRTFNGRNVNNKVQMKTYDSESNVNADSQRESKCNLNPRMSILYLSFCPQCLLRYRILNSENDNNKI
jgi:hypothetical protein